MDSLLTLPIGDFRLVDLVLRLAWVLVAAVALLLGLATMCVARSRRLPLILGCVALLAAAWFESGVAAAWRGAFELAGTSYCVTGLPMASEDRILAWAFGLPALLFCLGLSLLDPLVEGIPEPLLVGARAGRPGPVSNLFLLIGFLYCAAQLRRVLSPLSGETSPLLVLSCRIALLGMAAGILLTEAGRLHLLPLGKTADSLLVRGELIRSFGDILSLALPGAMLFLCILSLQKESCEADAVKERL